MLRKNKTPRHKQYRQRIASGKKGKYIDIALISLSAFVVVLLSSTAIRLVQGETRELPQEITILRTQIANGCGVDGAAGRFADWVKRKSSEYMKYDIIDVTDFENSAIPQTMVLVRDPMALDKAGQIAESLGIPRDNVSMSELTDNFLALDITIVVGKDFESYETKIPNLKTEILNGCGIRGAATQFTLELERISGNEMSFDIVGTENYSNFDVRETMLIIKSDKAENLSKSLADALNIKKDNIIISKAGKTPAGPDVTIVIGHDWGNRLTVN